MGWETKYWDTMDQLFWSLKYVGLEKAPRSHMANSISPHAASGKAVGTVSTFYQRARSAAEQRNFLLYQEETLNHVFDIAFGIAPDSLINDILLKPLGFADYGEFRSIGREIDKRYLEFGVGRFQQQDGFFVSQSAAVGVELKLGSKSTIDQMLKYAMLLGLEELCNGPKSQIGLLFITPDVSEDHWKACGLDGPLVSSDYYLLFPKARSKVVREFYAKHEQVMRSVLDRMMLGAISWSEFYRSLSTYQVGLGFENPGEQCLRRLIDGVLCQVAEHKLTGLNT